MMKLYSFRLKIYRIFFWYSIESNKAMTEICETGKCHQTAANESVLRAKAMFDTLRKNDICEENEAKQKK